MLNILYGVQHFTVFNTSISTLVFYGKLKFIGLNLTGVFVRMPSDQFAFVSFEYISFLRHNSNDRI
jgi:hypothetical protein